MAGSEQRVIKFAVWHGSVDDLKRVVDLVAELRENAVQSLQKELDVIREKAVLRHKSDMDRVSNVLSGLAQFQDTTTERQFTAGLSAALKGPELRPIEYAETEAMRRIRDLEITVYAERHTGPSLTAAPEVVFRTLHPTATKNLEVRFGSYGSDSRLSIDFKRQEGVALTVSGSDLTWVNGALERVGNLLQQGQPGYRFMRSPWFVFPVFFAFSLVATLWLAKALGADSVAEYSNWGLSPWLGMILFAEVWNRYVLPRFELYESGSKSRAKLLTGATFALVGFVSAVVGFVR